MLWSERQAKHETRNLILSLLDRRKANRVLGLPGSEAIFEKMLAKASFGPPPHCSLFERDSSLIPAIAQQLEALPLTYSLSNTDVDETLDDWMQHPQDILKYDLIWLDYCGPLTPLRLKNAARLHSLVQENGSYAFTFMMGREHEGVMNIVEALGSTDMFYTGGTSTLTLPDGMPNPLEIRIKTLLKTIWPSCRRAKITVISYHDTVPMYVLIVQKARLLGDNFVPVKRMSLEWLNLC